MFISFSFTRLRFIRLCLRLLLDRFNPNTREEVAFFPPIVHRGE